ncbi:MAG: hypothetical protein AAF597_20540 [Bacteroidota bacterium]
MRLIRYTLTFCLLAFFSFTAQAQLEFGGGVALNGNFNYFGVQARGQYTVDPTWRVAADFTYLFPEFGTAWEFNPNAHYVFQDDGAGQKFYALAGLNVWRRGTGDLGLNVIGVSSVGVTDVGFNVGAGANLLLGGLTGYAEAKFAVGGSELGVTVGILFGN